MQLFIECVSVFIGCFGFSLVFRSHHHLTFSFLGSICGSIGWASYVCFGFINNPVIQTFFAMCIVSFISECLARIYYAPATVFVIVGCFALVPGKGIYQSMYYCVSGQMSLFGNTLIETFGISGAIAFAILIVSTCFKITKTWRNRV